MFLDLMYSVPSMKTFDLASRSSLFTKTVCSKVFPLGLGHVVEKVIQIFVKFSALAELSILTILIKSVLKKASFL